VKFIALFLAFIVVMLTITPCCAVEESEGHTHETMKNEKHQCDEQDGDCYSDCSPFYVCGTCIGFTFTTQQLITFTVQLKPVQHNTAYIPVELLLIPLAIWQPPKLS